MNKVMENKSFKDLEKEILSEVVSYKVEYKKLKEEKEDQIDYDLWFNYIKINSKYKTKLVTPGELENDNTFNSAVIMTRNANVKDYINTAVIASSNDTHKLSKKAIERLTLQQEKEMALAIKTFLGLSSVQSLVVREIDNIIDAAIQTPAVQLAAGGVIVVKTIKFKAPGIVIDELTYAPKYALVIQVELEFKLLA